MNEYTIYCSEEQTKKAIELGAPILVAPEEFYVTLPHFNMKICGEYASVILPTAEQMLGWIEEKGVIITISNFHNEYGYSVSKFENNFDESISYHSAIDSNNSRKEATLAAIDATLNYLIEKKGE